ncbi:DUF4870 domain-containing protein [Bacillus testis]|uniref:DUF4870 domain-containing protein n=1 Tax=Bacillus testis TaxID=1622072 RepID=UPI00067E731B|nr:DUF4870 domain-containing protein [Bacillus testis]
METRKILAALSYFSVLVAPVIIPVIIWLASDDGFVKKHAKSSLLSHIIPLIFIPFLIMGMYWDSSHPADFPWFILAVAVIGGLVSLGLLIWNLVRGVKLLLSEK